MTEAKGNDVPLPEWRDNIGKIELRGQDIWECVEEVPHGLQWKNHGTLNNIVEARVQAAAVEIRGEYEKHCPIIYETESEFWLGCSCGWGQQGDKRNEGWFTHFDLPVPTDALDAMLLRARIKEASELGDKMNQFLQAIMTNAGNCAEDAAAHRTKSCMESAKAIEDLSDKAAKWIREHVDALTQPAPEKEQP